MKNAFLIALTCSLSTLCLSQSNTVSAGGEATGTGGSVSYSIGQIDYISASGTDGSINQGVQQPYEFFEELGLEEQTIITSLYPNPTNEAVILQIQDDISDMHYRLFDVNGKLINENQITQEKTLINLNQHSAGKYFLHLLRKEEQLKSIKIIKH